MAMLSERTRLRAQQMLDADRHVNHIIAKNRIGGWSACAIKLNVKDNDRLWLLSLASAPPETRQVIVGRSNAIAWLRMHQAEGTDLQHNRGPAFPGPMLVGADMVFKNTTDGFIYLTSRSEDGGPLDPMTHIPVATLNHSGDTKVETTTHAEGDTTMTAKKTAKPKTPKAAKAPKAPKAAKEKAPKKEFVSKDGLYTFAFRVTAEERDAIHAAAEAKEMSASAWVKGILATAAARATA